MKEGIIMYEFTTALKMCTGCRIVWTRSKSSDNQESKKCTQDKYEGFVNFV